MRVLAILNFVLTLGALLAGTAAEGAAGRREDSLVDAIVSQGVPLVPLQNALRYLNAHRAEVPNRKVLTLVDYSRPITEKRLHLIDLASGTVEHFHVAHARKSDPGLTGVPEYFSNVFNSEKTALGYFRTANAYDGSLGRSLVLKGLDRSNSRTEIRKIVVHGWFVGPQYASHYGTEKCPLQGGCPTMGCFGVPYSEAGPLIEKIKDGSLIFAFTRKGGVRAYDP